MQHYIDQYNKAISFNQYLVSSAVEYWTTVSFPAIYFAKYL